MAEQKWILYEMLKKLAGRILEVSQGSGQLWQQHEMICGECEKVAEQICGLTQMESEVRKAQGDNHD